MTRLRIASQFVAVVAGAYAALMLIDGQLIDVGVAAAICAVASVAAGLIACAGGRRRQAVAPGPAAVCEGRDQQAVTVADEQCTLCGCARQKLSDSPRFVNRQSARHARRPLTQSRHDEPADGLGASSDGLSSERMRRWTASPALAFPAIGLGARRREPQHGGQAGTRAGPAITHSATPARSRPIAHRRVGRTIPQ